MFVDEVVITVKAGDGGNGCMAFRREKYVPRGGPSGGDGGMGGDIILESSQQHNTLLHFRFNPEHKAPRGRHGEGSKRKGKDGDFLLLRVPVGCVIINEDSGEKLHDFLHAGEQFIIARGGRGGRGNARFATSTNQAPRRVEPGEVGEFRRLRMVLKLLADVGIVGLPNVGKSFLLSRISAARPKVADYPFTTLEPVLGMVRVSDDASFVAADVPGLIEGAHLGHGLGTRFLRHIERTRLLVHLIDASELAGPDAEHDYRIILAELGSFQPDLSHRPMLLVASRIDMAGNGDRLRAIQALAAREHLQLFPVSSATGEGIEQLKLGIWKMLLELPHTDDAPEMESHFTESGLLPEQEESE
ncbi:MAG: GTPase ObgE [Acidobacteria bacterium RIFCSPLOWO2_12_FULL_54_10]|nr:MAG: GTPase ObgE [Acidobacteria bacterium RIFCSPLOWO2_12_FULL_54_10]